MFETCFGRFGGFGGVVVPFGWPDQELSVEYSQSSVAALGVKLALLLRFSNPVKIETNA